MKSYSTEITINKPLHEVTRLFTAIEHYPDWQPNLDEYNTFEGAPTQTGAKSKIVYKEGRNDDVKMVETVLQNDLPEMYRVKISTDGVISYQDHSFIQEGENQTSYRIETRYDLDGLMTLMNILNPNHFKKQTEEFMDSFKKFAESR